MRGQGTPMSLTLESQGEFVGDGVVEGLLYSLGPYPGFTDSADGRTDLVRGEVFRIREAGLWGRLDEFEGREYERVIRRVRLGLDSGVEVDAWLYRYQADLRDRPRIESGDWREY